MNNPVVLPLEGSDMTSTEGNGHGSDDPTGSLVGDVVPVLRGEIEESSESPPKRSIEEMEEILWEMDIKHAPYVRHDTYGTMGKGEISLCEKLKLVFSFLVLVPVKMVLLFMIVVTYYIICRCCTMFRTPVRDGVGVNDDDGNSGVIPLLRTESELSVNGEGEEEISDTMVVAKSQENYAHLTGIRRRIIVYTGRLFSRAILFVLGFYWITIIRMDTQQPEQLKGGEIPDKIRPGAIVSNHASYIDILYHMSASFPSFVAKRSVSKLPLIGLISKCLGCVFVRREDKPSDFKGAAGIITKRLQDAVSERSAPLMMLFPEGTTTNGFYLLPFKTGAFLAGVPIQPVILKYPYTRFSAAWDSISGIRHVILLLCQFVNWLEILWLPVYVPSEEEKADPKLYASNVRKQMAFEGGLFLSEIGLKEKRIYHTFLNEYVSLKD